MRVPWMLLLATVASACGHTPTRDARPARPEVPPDETRPNARYLCGDVEVTADFAGDGSVRLVYGERTLLLRHVPAASGAKYADGEGNEFWTRETALLTLAGQPARKCLRSAGD